MTIQSLQKSAVTVVYLSQNPPLALGELLADVNYVALDGHFDFDAERWGCTPWVVWPAVREPGSLPDLVRALLAAKTTEASLYVPIVPVNVLRGVDPTWDEEWRGLLVDEVGVIGETLFVRLTGQSSGGRGQDAGPLLRALIVRKSGSNSDVADLSLKQTLTPVAQQDAEQSSSNEHASAYAEEEITREPSRSGRSVQRFSSRRHLTVVAAGVIALLLGVGAGLSLETTAQRIYAVTLFVSVSLSLCAVFLIVRRATRAISRVQGATKRMELSIAHLRIAADSSTKQLAAVRKRQAADSRRIQRVQAASVASEMQLSFISDSYKSEVR